MYFFLIQFFFRLHLIFLYFLLFLLYMKILWMVSLLFLLYDRLTFIRRLLRFRTYAVYLKKSFYNENT